MVPSRAADGAVRSPSPRPSARSRGPVGAATASARARRCPRTLGRRTRGSPSSIASSRPARRRARAVRARARRAARRPSPSRPSAGTRRRRRTARLGQHTRRTSWRPPRRTPSRPRRRPGGAARAPRRSRPVDDDRARVRGEDRLADARAVALRLDRDAREVRSAATGTAHHAGEEEARARCRRDRARCVLRPLAQPGAVRYEARREPEASQHDQRLEIALEERHGACTGAATLRRKDPNRKLSASSRFKLSPRASRWRHSASCSATAASRASPSLL